MEAVLDSVGSVEHGHFNQAVDATVASDRALSHKAHHIEATCSIQRQTRTNAN